MNEQTTTDEGEVKVDPPSKESSVLDRLEQRELQAKVQQCIAALDPDFREVIVLRDLQEFSYEDIGTMLTVAAGTVKSRLFRAREAVKECLKLVGHADIIELESLVHSFQGQDEEPYSPFVTASMDSHPRQAWLGADDLSA